MCGSCARTTVFGVFDTGNTARSSGSTIMCRCRAEHEPRQRCWRIVAKRAVLAAGALERPIVFGDNDRPGVMLAGAVRTYVNRYAAAPGERLAVFTNNDDGWRTAADARAAGVEIAAVVDSRAEPPAQFAALGVKAMTGAQVSHVHGRLGVAGDRRDRCRRPRDEDRMRRARRVGRLESGGASHLPSRRQAGVERAARGLRARRSCRPACMSRARRTAR